MHEPDRTRFKVCCEECCWRGTWADMLTAENPFNPGTNVEGCPQCLEINTVYKVCDEPDCWEPATCGTPTPDRYRHTCGGHKPPNAMFSGAGTEVEK